MSAIRCLLLLGSLLVANTSAENLIVEDPSGDVVLEAGSQQAGNPEYPAVDILRLEIGDETRESVHLSLQMAALEGPADAIHPFEVRSYAIDFDFGGIHYRVQAPDHRCATGQAAVVLLTGIGGRNVGCIEVQVESVDRWLRFPVPKEFLLDAAGLSPRLGSVLENASATVRELLTVVGVSTYAVDRAPDTGGAATWPFTAGTYQAGLVEITPVQSTRYSNGGAGTTAFTLIIYNAGEAAEVVQFESTTVPRGWQVSHADQVFLPAGGESTIPIIVTTPSGHVHGGQETLELRVRVGNAMATLPLTLAYLETPQPAGHHPTLYLHTAEGSERWMNTLPEQGQDLPAAHTMQNYEGNGFRGHWVFPMQPGLQLGLQWKDEGAIKARFGAFTPGGMRDVHFMASLYHCPGIGAATHGTERINGCDLPATLLGAGGVDATLDQTPKAVEIVMPLAVPGASFAPSTLANLLFLVEMTSSIPEPGPGELMTRIDPKESRIDLPLLEYLDQIDASAASTGIIAINRHTPYESRAPPNSIAYAKFQVSALEDLSAALRITGHNEAWARIVNTPSLQIGIQPRDILVEVHIPAAAPNEEFAELFLFVEGQRGSAASKFRIVVDDAAPAMTKPAADLQVPEPKGSPAPGIAFIGIALATCIALHRRRNRS